MTCGVTSMRCGVNVVICCGADVITCVVMSMWHDVDVVTCGVYITRISLLYLTDGAGMLSVQHCRR